jgi:hypothetical protein
MDLVMLQLMVFWLRLSLEVAAVIILICMLLSAARMD